VRAVGAGSGDSQARALVTRAGFAGPGLAQARSPIPMGPPPRYAATIGPRP